MSSTHSLVVFDLDGTLYDTRSSFFTAVKEFLRIYRCPAQDPVKLEGFIGEPPQVWESWIKTLGIKAPLDQQKAEFDRLELEAVNKSGRLYPGAEQVIAELAASGLALGICSNGRSVYVHNILENFNLTRFFQVIKIPLSTADTKAVMLAHIRALINPHTAFMVGDRRHDIEAAAANGFISIGAAYGFGPSEIKGADYIIQYIKEVLRIVLSH
ncbi:MAG: HAD family hydrolase [Calditrichota bacterium]